MTPTQEITRLAYQVKSLDKRIERIDRRIADLNAHKARLAKGA